MLAVIGSRPLSLWIGAGTGKESDWIDQAFYFGMIVGSWAVVTSRRVNWNKLFAANIAMTLFYLYLATTSFWSADPVGSFKRWFKVCGMVFVVLVILSEKEPLQAMRAVYIRCASVLFSLSVVFIRYYPNLGQSYSRSGEKMFTGVTTQKNSLGEIVMVFGLFLIWDYLETLAARPKPLWRRMPLDGLLLLPMGAWLLSISESKTALLCLLIGVTVMVAHGRVGSLMVNRVILLGTLSLPFFLLLTQQLSPVVAPLVGAFGRNMTFTGRTYIWQNILADKALNPFIGGGFQNYWADEGAEAIRQALQTGVSSAHNGYLELYLDGGLIALGLLFYLFWTKGSRLVERLRRSARLRNVPPPMVRYQHLRFAILIVAIYYSLSESGFARLMPIWFTTVLVLMDYPVSVGGRRQVQRELHSGDEGIVWANADVPRCASH